MTSATVTYIRLDLLLLHACPVFDRFSQYYYGDGDPVASVPGAGSLRSRDLFPFFFFSRKRFTPKRRRYSLQSYGLRHDCHGKTVLVLATNPVSVHTNEWRFHVDDVHTSVYDETLRVTVRGKGRDTLVSWSNHTG